ncbi:MULTISPECIES: membrane protein insertion efficiency factor YidD [Tsukamurella]
MRQLPRRALIGMVQWYRTWISPMRPPTCRFMPTCSEYAVEALSRYGAVRGVYLSTIRLLKCGPWHRGGWDPVPE